MRGWAMAAVALLVPVGAAGQGVGEVTGTVCDDEGAPVALAQVVVAGGAASALTGVDGRFRLRPVPAGRRQLRVSLIGYAAARREVEVPAGGRATLELRLERTPVSVEGLQVTGTVGVREPAAVAQATTQLSGRALERELGGTLAQALRSQPGLAVRSMGPAATAPVIRGLTGDRVLVLQDGHRTADLAGSADDHGVTVDPLAAQRVEVVRGPATLLYGNNALGGVVNVISDDVPTSVPLRAGGGVGAQAESAFPGGSAAGRVAVPLGERWVVGARGGARRTGDMRVGDGAAPEGRLANTDFRNGTASLGVGHVGERGTGGLAARWYGFRYGLPVPPGTDPVSLEGSRRELLGRWTALLDGPVQAMEADAAVQRYGHDELDSRDGALLQRFRLDTGSASVLLRQGPLGPLAEGAWGVSGLWKRYDNAGPGALTPPAESRAVGVFGFQEAPLPGGVALQAGARYDVYRIDSEPTAKHGPGAGRVFRAVSGSVGARVELGGGASLGISAARSFRAPTVEELFSAAAHAGTGAVELGSSALAAERGRSVEAVLRVQRPGVIAQLAAYRNEVDGFVHLVARGDTVLDGARLPVLEYGQGHALLWGVEGSAEWGLGGAWVAGAMGDYVHAEHADGTPLSYMPAPRLGAMLRRDDGRISLGADLHHELRQHRVGAAGETPTPAHTTLRLTAGARFTLGGRLHSLSLRGENLTDEAHREATSRIKDFAPGPGRNLGLVYRVYF